MSRSPKYVKKSKICQEVQKMPKSPKDIKKSKRCQRCHNYVRTSLCQVKILWTSSTVKVFEQMLSQKCLLPTIVTSLHTPPKIVTSLHIPMQYCNDNFGGMQYCNDNFRGRLPVGKPNHFRFFQCFFVFWTILASLHLSINSKKNI